MFKKILLKHHEKVEMLSHISCMIALYYIVNMILCLLTQPSQIFFAVTDSSVAVIFASVFLILQKYIEEYC